MQDVDCSFEQNLSAKSAHDSKQVEGPLHYSQALAALCEVCVRAGKFTEALEILKDIKSVYDPKKHTMVIGKAYGCDCTSHVFSQAALWYYKLGQN